METTGTAVSNPPEPKSAALAAAGAIPVGMEAFNPLLDLVIPDMKVGQPTTRKIPPTSIGKFFSSLDPNEAYEKVRVVFLTMGHGRVLFARNEDGTPDFDGETVCRSDDGFLPSSQIKTPVAPRCIDARTTEGLCPNAKWSDGSEPPACSETRRFLAVNLETGMPFRFSLKSTDIGTVKKFTTNVMLQARASGLAFYDFEAQLSLAKREEKKGVWYATVFSDLKKVEPGTHKALYELYVPRAAAQDAAERAEAAKKAEAAGGVTGTVVDADAQKTAGSQPPPSNPPAPAGDGKKPKGKGANKEMDFQT